MSPAVVDVEIERDKAGSYGIGLADHGGGAWVRQIQGEAAKQGRVKFHDRITHVDGEGPLDYDGVVAALSKGPSPVKLTVARGARPPVTKGTAGVRVLQDVRLLSCAACLVAAVVYNEAMRDVFVDVGKYLDTWAPADLSSTSGAEPAAADQPATAQTSRPAWKIGGRLHYFSDEGEPEDMDALRDAIRGDDEAMSELRQNGPEWARVVKGFADGSYNRKAFRKLLRDQWQRDAQSAELNKGLELNADGTAVDPAVWLASAMAEEGQKWLNGVKRVDEKASRRAVARTAPLCPGRREYTSPRTRKSGADCREHRR